MPKPAKIIKPINASFKDLARAVVRPIPQGKPQNPPQDKSRK